MLLAGLGAGAQAQPKYSYTCRVGSQVITGEFEPYECRNVEIRVLNPDGSLNHVIAPQKTELERERDRQAEIERQHQEEARRNQERSDRALLEHYPTVEELIAEKNAALGSRERLVERAQTDLDDLRKEREKLDSEAEFYKNHQMPVGLQRKLEISDDLQRKQAKLIADLRAGMQGLAEHYDAQIKRWHELMERSPRSSSAVAAPGGRAPDANDRVADRR
ncbi:MAG TPA: hypothetical protein VMU08_07235 [Rhizomicrobium sp.]|nr:hypothetical protein [Rhizomicrobium sp.]